MGRLKSMRQRRTKQTHFLAHPACFDKEDMSSFVSTDFAKEHI
jgi:hypothetical protein